MFSTTGERKQAAADFAGVTATSGPDPDNFSAFEQTATAFGQAAATGLRGGTVRRDPSEIKSGLGSIDSVMLDRAIETVESIDPGDSLGLAIGIASLSGLVCELWRSAKGSSRFHRQVLTALDNAVICALRADSITPNQLFAMREALVELKSPILTQVNVDSIASHLADEDYSPLAMLGDLKTGPSNNE